VDLDHVLLRNDGDSEPAQFQLVSEPRNEEHTNDHERHEHDLLNGGYNRFIAITNRCESRCYRNERIAIELDGIRNIVIIQCVVAIEIITNHAIVSANVHECTS
jgi:hypothetical protein